MIRRATDADAPALARLNRHVQAFHAEAEPEIYRVSDLEDLRAWMEEYLAKPYHEVLLYERGGEALGYAAMRCGRHEATPFLWGRSYVYVDQLGVAPGARRRGIGRALMEAVHARADELEVDAIELDVRAVNPGARAFYAALGYAPTRLSLRRPLRAEGS